MRAPLIRLGWLLALLITSSPASAVTTAWTPIGNLGNACEAQAGGCYGTIRYAYSIGTYEVTNAQYVEFLNAKAASDPLGLYNTGMSSGSGGITRTGSLGSYIYSPIAGRENMPVNYVDFYDALRFANWMNNGQGNADTETGAYTLLGGTPEPSNGTTVTRNAGATIVLPSEDEWYKAAYHNATGFSSNDYFNYTAGSDTQTACSAPTATANRANCSNAVANFTVVGSYTGSASPYGTFDQGGNVWEWDEVIISGSARGVRGGSYGNSASAFAASQRSVGTPTVAGAQTGFRLAMVPPEPTTGPLVFPSLLEWVEIDHPANTPKQQFPNVYFGGVAYVYWMSKYEVTNAQYAQFLNAKAASDPLGLYDTNMGTSSYGGIARSGDPGAYGYSAINGREDMPVTFVSFIDAARFVNWLQNGEGDGDTETGAYTLEGGTADPSNWQTVTRNSGARVFVPSQNEWYKAAYHNAAGLSSADYFDYPCGSNTAPVCSAPTATPNRANCRTAAGAPAQQSPAGSYSGSPSPYGTFDQGGNVGEWTEAIRGQDIWARVVRGGSWDQYSADTAAWEDSTGAAAIYGWPDIGFRVATLPEPAGVLGLASGVAGLIGLAGWRRRNGNRPASLVCRPPSKTASTRSRQAAQRSAVGAGERLNKWGDG